MEFLLGDGASKANLVVWLLGATPTEAFVELAGAGKVGHAERHEADALLHGIRILMRAWCRRFARRN
jgi:hypothetical protein